MQTRMLSSILASAACALACACHPPDPPRAAPPPPPAPRPPMTADEARRYMVELINRDRASEGLPPVTLDEGAATHAGQAHADDMAENGYLGHWGTDGSVPESRYTAAGGKHMVLENASCFVDAKHRPLDAHTKFDPAEIEHTEAMFFGEVPPNDGHRKNILKPWHTKVGIGIAQPRATPTEIPVPCIAQEFVDDYGTYADIPAVATIGARIHVAAKIPAPAKPAGVGLARIDLPEPITVAEANTRRSYLVPPPYQMYWPTGYVTPIAVTIKGADLSIDVPLGEGQKPGMYEVSIWAKLPTSPDFQIVSLRTLRVVARP
jgi:hypothetical protein